MSNKNKSQKKTPEKSKKKKIAIISICIAIALIAITIAVSLLVLSIHNIKPVAAFYGLDESQKSAIEIQLQKTLPARKTGNKMPYEIIVLDNTLSLEDSIKQSGKTPDLIFTKMGINAENAAKYSLSEGFSFNKSLLKSATTSVQGLAKEPYANKDKTAVVPLITDLYIVDIKSQDYNQTGMNNLATLEDFEFFFEKTKKIKQTNSVYTPLIFAGGEDQELLNILQVICEATDNINSVKEAKKIIRSELKKDSPDFEQLAKNLILEGGPFYKTANLLYKWHQNGYIPANYLQMKNDDLSFYMANNLTSSAIMTLSHHRTIKHNIVSNYLTIYMPSTHLNVQRSFSAPVIAAISYGKKSLWKQFTKPFLSFNENDIEKSIKNLLDEKDGSIAGQTKLAPVHNYAPTIDKQSDDTRYWIAGSETPSIPLSDDCFYSKDYISRLANEIRVLLKYK